MIVSGNTMFDPTARVVFIHTTLHDQNEMVSAIRALIDFLIRLHTPERTCSGTGRARCETARWRINGVPLALRDLSMVWEDGKPFKGALVFDGELPRSVKLNERFTLNVNGREYRCTALGVNPHRLFFRIHT